MNHNTRRAPRYSIELDIKELTLHGFDPGDCHRIARAIERELARLLATQPLPPALAQGGQVARLDGGTFHVTLGTGAQAIATQVAQAVYGGLNR